MKQFFSIIILTGLFATANGQTINGLVGSYYLNGNANDNSGNNLNGTLSNVTTGSDRSSNSNCAYQFSEINSSNITLPSNQLFRTSEASASFWVYFDPTHFDQPDHKNLIDFDNGCGNAYNIGANDTTTSNQNNFAHVQVLQSDDPNFCDLRYRDNSTLVANQWYHIACTMGSDSIKIYVNGTKTAAYYTGYSVSYDNTSQIQLGEELTGKLDQVKFFNRVLTSSEISQLFNEPSDCNISGIEMVSSNNISVYPNPSNTTVRILNSKFDNYELVNLQGQTLLSGSNQTNEISVSNLKTGIYFINLYYNQRLTGVTKMIKE